MDRNASTYCNFSFSAGVALSLLSVFVSVVGTCGNVLILLIPCFCPHLRNASNFMILNLSVADLVVTSIAFPLNGVWILARVKGNCTSDELLYARRVAITFSSSASLFILALVSVERLCVISWPLRYKTYVTRERLAVATISGWLSSFGFGVLAAYKAFSRLVELFAIIATSLFYVVITLCYVRILIVTVRQSAVRSELHVHARRSHCTLERRVAKTMAIVIGVFTLCLVPYTVMRKAISKGHAGVLYDALLMLALSHSAANPLIYFFRSKEYRSALKRICLRCQCRVKISPRVSPWDSVIGTQFRLS